MKIQKTLGCFTSLETYNKFSKIAEQEGKTRSSLISKLVNWWIQQAKSGKKIDSL